jgi:Zn-dependent protease with chaperone function
MGDLVVAEAVRRGLVSETGAERLEDVTRSLCDMLGLVVPELSVIFDPAPNAIALGGSPPRLILTSGAVESFDRITLEAVLAHELAHVKRLDTLPAGICSALLGGGSSPVPGGRRLAGWLDGELREVEADLAAAMVTRYPPGLISALQEAGAAGSGTDPSPEGAAEARRGRGARLRTACHWFVPLRVEDDGDWAAGLEERLDVLREL